MWSYLRCRRCIEMCSPWRIEVEIGRDSSGSRGWCRRIRRRCCGDGLEEACRRTIAGILVGDVVAGSFDILEEGLRKVDGETTKRRSCILRLMTW